LAAVRLIGPVGRTPIGDNHMNVDDLPKKAADGSSATQALSSSCDDSDEEDVEPCEEHYRVPPAKDEEELDRRDFLNHES
jgi:hypothetical protein